MRKIINIDEIRKNKNFWLYFFISNFPESLDEDSDSTLTEIIEENYAISKDWVDKLTQNYDGVFDENDGYVTEPNTLELALCDNNKVFIEYHPGDTIYYINDTQIGCTGPHYVIRKISWNDYSSYFKGLSSDIKLLFLPMVYITEKNIGELCSLIETGLQKAEVSTEHYKLIYNAIIENCLEQ